MVRATHLVTFQSWRKLSRVCVSLALLSSSLTVYRRLAFSLRLPFALAPLAVTARAAGTVTVTQ